jgi:hypothetical protein
MHCQENGARWVYAAINSEACADCHCADRWGFLIASFGVVKGVHVALLVTLVLAVVTIVLVSRINITASALHATSIVGVWQTFHTALKRLLLSDAIIRTCEGMTGVITILYVTNVQRFTIKQYATLVAIQMITSILVYILAGKLPIALDGNRS